MLESNFDKKVGEFVRAANKFKVRMILVGGGAVNFYGYQRHSADVDFWIDISVENLERLKKALIELGYEFPDFPEKVKQALQNISLKISPLFEIELITRFNPGKTFDEAFADCEKVETGDKVKLHWNVLSYEDLIMSKQKSARPKDLLDIQELKRIKS
jgi:predicted nucleotidyltransferase